jgi:RNA polymerase sigma factor (sigma-70 family)
MDATVVQLALQRRTEGQDHRSVSRTSSSYDWAKLYSDHRGAMCAVAAASLPRWRSADVVDVANEAFAGVMKNPPESVDNWEALLVQATKLRAIDYMKRADVKNVLLNDDDEIYDIVSGEALEVDGVADEAIRRLNAAVVRGKLLEILGTLSPQQRDVVERRLLQSMSVGRIAEEIGTSAANVSQLLRKGLLCVAIALEGLEVNPADVDALRPRRRRGGQGG